MATYFVLGQLHLEPLALPDPARPREAERLTVTGMRLEHGWERATRVVTEGAALSHGLARRLSQAIGGFTLAHDNSACVAYFAGHLLQSEAIGPASSPGSPSSAEDLVRGWVGRLYGFRDWVIDVTVPVQGPLQANEAETLPIAGVYALLAAVSAASFEERVGQPEGWRWTELRTGAPDSPNLVLSAQTLHDLGTPQAWSEALGEPLLLLDFSPEGPGVRWWEFGWGPAAESGVAVGLLPLIERLERFAAYSFSETGALFGSPLRSGKSAGARP